VVTNDKEKLERTTIKDKTFIGANGKEKTLYELSEYIYYFYKWGVIKKRSTLRNKIVFSRLKQS